MTVNEQDPAALNLNAEEATFVKAICDNPSCVASRLAYSDWLEEHGKHAHAVYLRQIRPHKFLRRWRSCGAWALMPPTQMPKRWKRPYITEGERPVLVIKGSVEEYWNAPPPNQTERLNAVLLRIKRGWRPNKHVRKMGYYTAAVYYGVPLWEYLNILSHQV